MSEWGAAVLAGAEVRAGGPKERYEIWIFPSP
jgi:hypothetical protein